MALPREPRQKMINMMYLVLTALLALNVSSEILNAFKTVNKSLENTNTTVNKSTETIMASLLDKTKDPSSANRANIWYPKAQQVQTLSKSIFAYVQTLKDQILREAGGDPNNPEQKFKEDNLDIATRIMIEKGEGQKLLAALDNYKKTVLKVDPAIDSAFKTTLPINLDKPASKNQAGKTWEGAYFHMVPTVAALTILSKFQNDVKTSENRIVQFCHNKVGEVNVVFDSYGAVIGQSSNYLMPGQEIEITAGVGAFSKKAQPIIVVGGSPVQIGDDGAAHTKLQGGGVGQHSIPVKITYMNQETGKMETIEKNVTYTVGQANASIALDEMNVLYVGYDNKVTIAASGGGDDKVQASISGGGGSLVKVGGGKYIAKVNTVTDDCKITVSVDGKVAGVSQFRVRTIPQPAATVGAYPSGESISAGAFKAQSGVGAYIKDFPLNLKYSVTSFTIAADNAEGDIDEAACQGNLWSPKALQIVRGLGPNRTVTIDNIRAVGPDGRNQKLPSLVYYIK
ncbi:gliding motility protein GldM [Terrimonas pollutisoli]|uniref:type IX secretion system motor protein PorM/GldM n=1 Tax=Terrimonas pollutisoli TaxID=3034147 RepID=UPI0023EB6927|nr:gliding motility protein GldM [Terrimonas sp. H1YJ31]